MFFFIIVSHHLILILMHNILSMHIYFIFSTCSSHIHYLILFISNLNHKCHTLPYTLFLSYSFYYSRVNCFLPLEGAPCLSIMRVKACMCYTFALKKSNRPQLLPSASTVITTPQSVTLLAQRSGHQVSRLSPRAARGKGQSRRWEVSLLPDTVPTLCYVNWKHLQETTEERYRERRKKNMT